MRHAVLMLAGHLNEDELNNSPFTEKLISHIKPGEEVEIQDYFEFEDNWGPDWCFDIFENGKCIHTEQG